MATHLKTPAAHTHTPDHVRNTTGNLINNSKKGVQQRLKLLTTVVQLITKPCITLFGNTTLLQTLVEGDYDAVLTFAMPGDDVESCGCILGHYLRVPVITVHGIPFLTAPLGTPQVGDA